ncbi:hypothetical protein GGS23DRAFT_351104 [Durotheca rogersii]|uniref:uncharacterized protein n=1 Tax=Durotheca rogersii TaxID=419775 RepID=UPI00221ECCD2|nr:uncharacterized protein GGS23DRAFT_351104 [Durotheca rogersii]KAI5865697.1 hypothetical protein GGS23DRAFT_351104 [Durotheca rogersii]
MRPPPPRLYPRGERAALYRPHAPCPSTHPPSPPRALRRGLRFAHRFANGPNVCRGEGRGAAGSRRARGLGRVGANGGRPERPIDGLALQADSTVSQQAAAAPGSSIGASCSSPPSPRPPTLSAAGDGLGLAHPALAAGILAQLRVPAGSRRRLFGVTARRDLSGTYVFLSSPGGKRAWGRENRLVVTDLSLASHLHMSPLRTYRREKARKFLSKCVWAILRAYTPSRPSKTFRHRLDLVLVFAVTVVTDRIHFGRSALQ